MTSLTKPRFSLLVSSALATILVSIVSAWIVNSPAAPVAQVPIARGSEMHHSSSRHLFQISPIPPGADWTS